MKAYFVPCPVSTASSISPLFSVGDLHAAIYHALRRDPEIPKAPVDSLVIHAQVKKNPGPRGQTGEFWFAEDMFTTEFHPQSALLLASLQRSGLTIHHQKFLIFCPSDECNPTNAGEVPKSSNEGRIEKKPLFVVGAGGIGCELLKLLILCGFRHIDVIDLDTIDATNLNRQFLFQSPHVGHSKAQVAAKVLQSFCEGLSTRSSSSSSLHIQAHHGNVKDAKYDVDFYKQFAIVINALDNMSARKHVNRMCMQANIPLVESGTLGYNGQVQPILKGRYQCYDCAPKPADQKTFAVCTIHAHPTSMIHCVHYAKEFYGRLFGDIVSSNATDEMQYLDAAMGGGKDETQDPSATARHLFSLIFEKKIEELLEMRGPNAPEPAPRCLDIENIILNSGAVDWMENCCPVEKIPSVNQCCAAFIRSTMACIQRGRSAFKKEDVQAVEVVASVANLRAFCFHIELQSFFDLKTIAGSIVPAIASTNAIIAACAVHTAIQILHSGQGGKQLEERTNSHYIYLRAVPQSRKRRRLNAATMMDHYLLHSNSPEAPNPSCYICSSKKSCMTIRLAMSQFTIGTFVKRILLAELSFVAPIINLASSGNTIYEHEEFESQSNVSLSHFVSNENSSSVEFVIGDLYQELEWNASIHNDASLIDATMFSIEREQPVTATSTTTNEKGAEERRAAGTKAVVDNEGINLYHPSKKKMRLEGTLQDQQPQHSGQDCIEID